MKHKKQFRQLQVYEIWEQYDSEAYIQEVSERALKDLSFNNTVARQLAFIKREQFYHYNELYYTYGNNNFYKLHLLLEKVVGIPKQDKEFILPELTYNTIHSSLSESADYEPVDVEADPISDIWNIETVRTMDSYSL